MSLCAHSARNKQYPAYSARGVFRVGSRGGRLKIRDGRRVALLGLGEDRRCSSIAAMVLRPADPTHAFPPFSGARIPLVAPIPSHSGAGTADFRASQGVRRVMASYATRADQVPDPARLGGAGGETGGGASPLSIDARAPYARSAVRSGNPENSGPALPNSTGCTSRALDRIANVSRLHPGSGVRDAQAREILAPRGAREAGKGRKSGGLGVSVHGPVDRGNGLTLESVRA